MFNTSATALLPAVLDDVCKCVSQREIGARTQVALKLMEAATMVNASSDALKQVGRDASRAPTMWR